MIYAVDIDGTLCSDMQGSYKYCKPYPAVISCINALHASGHKIIIHTARSEQRRLLTALQLASWGVQYHQLVMGKPKADKYVDADSLRPEEL